MKKGCEKGAFISCKEACQDDGPCSKLFCRIIKNIHNHIWLYYTSNKWICGNIYVYYLGTFFWTAENQVCSEIEKQILVDKSQCKEAAVSGNLRYWEEDQDDTLFPTGCFQVTSVFWNLNQNGKKQPQAKAICKDLGGCIIFISFVVNWIVR